MGKKKNRKREPEVIIYPIETELQKFKMRYASFLTNISDDELRKWYQESIANYQKESGISWEIDSAYYVETKMFSRMNSLILEGDIDLEIEVIQRYSSMAKLILKQCNYQGTEGAKIVDLAITDAIENYDGTSNFRTLLVKSVKAMITKLEEKKTAPVKKVEPPIQSPLKPEITASKPRKKVDIPTITTPLMEESIPKRNLETILMPCITKDKTSSPSHREVSELDLLIASLDIVSKAPLDDENYVRFLALKYGYFQTFYSFDEIASILNMNRERVIAYYKQSLTFVKDWFGYALEKYFTYILTNDENE